MATNKLYKIVTIIMILGFGFFFSTKLWGEDDRPYHNTYTTMDLYNSQALVRVEDVVYMSQINALDVILETTYLNGISSKYELVPIVHNLDGTEYDVELDRWTWSDNGNKTRAVYRIQLENIEENEKQNWYYVELFLIDSTDHSQKSVTMDYRKVKTTDQIMTSNDYNISYENPSPSIFNSQTDGTISNEQNATDSETPVTESPTTGIEEKENITYSKEELQQQLDLKLEEFERLKQDAASNPEDTRLQDLVQKYQEEIANLEQQINAE